MIAISDVIKESAVVRILIKERKKLIQQQKGSNPLWTHRLTSVGVSVLINIDFVKHNAVVARVIYGVVLIFYLLRFASAW